MHIVFPLQNTQNSASTPNLAAALHVDICQRVQEIKSTSPSETIAPSQLTVGIEHEFFLLNGAGESASHQESQKLLSAIGKSGGCQVVCETDGSGAEYIAEVLFNTDDAPDFKAKVKYDHHPHLMEIASAPQRNLHDLQTHLQMMFSLVDEAATMCQLAFSKDANLRQSAAHTSLQSPLPAFQDLRFYRRKLLERHAPCQSLDESWVGHFSNYAAVVAATQVHVGGLEWWENNEIISRLYCYEPDLLFFSSIFPKIASDDFSLSERWNGYKSVFEQYPLAGFPRFDEWTMQSWQKALLESPLAGGADDTWAALSALEYAQLPNGSWDVFWKNVRDLQIIRPRFFGTLEFRADPAQPSVEAIMGMAALRLGLCCHVLTTVAESRTFASARDIWWEAVTVSEPPALSSTMLKTFNDAFEGLKSRQMGEEKYLQSAFPEFVRMI